MRLDHLLSKELRGVHDVPQANGTSDTDTPVSVWRGVGLKHLVDMLVTRSSRSTIGEKAAPDASAAGESALVVGPGEKIGHAV